MSIFNYAYELVEAPVTSARKGMKTLRNFRKRKYREFEFGPDKHQRVILYEPQEVRHDAVILYFHGGGYMLGDPADMGVAADLYCGEGFRFLSIGYRLLQDAPFPAQVEDAFKGYAVSMKILEMIGVQDPPVIVGGNSAGAHLAALLAYATELQRRFGVDTRSIVGVLSIAGVMDIRNILAGKSGPLAEKYSEIWDPEELLLYSPIDVLDIDSTAHFLAIHGKQDRLSSYTSELQFVKRLNAIDQARRELYEETARREEAEAAAAEDAEEISRIEAEGGGSTPVAKYTGWEEIGLLTEEDSLAQIIGLRKWKYQHIRLSAGIYTEKPKDSRILRMILRWMEKFDGLAIVLDPDPSFPAKAVLTRDTFHEHPKEASEVLEEYEYEYEDPEEEDPEFEDFGEDGSEYEDFGEDGPEYREPMESGEMSFEDELREYEEGSAEAAASMAGPEAGYAAYYEAAYGSESEEGEWTEPELSGAQTLTVTAEGTEEAGAEDLIGLDSPTITAVRRESEENDG